jgi:hypothetical protein
MSVTLMHCISIMSRLIQLRVGSTMGTRCYRLVATRRRGIPSTRFVSPRAALLSYWDGTRMVLTFCFTFAVVVLIATA